MSWARIMAPLSGAPSDEATLAAAAALATPFEAELAAVFAPADAAELMPWMGEGFMGGVQVAALDSLKEAAEIGEKHARTHFAAAVYGDKSFTTLTSPVATALAMEARLSDVVVFAPDPARGRGPLVESFPAGFDGGAAAGAAQLGAGRPAWPRRWRWRGTAGERRLVRPASPCLGSRKRRGF